MRRIKLAVSLVFLCLFLGFELTKTDPVAGQEGGTTLAAPTGMTASDNAYNSKVGLYWDTIRGATNYRIFRNSVDNPATATDVGISVSNSFFDVNAQPGQTFFYWVRAENGAALSEFSTADQGSRAIGQPQGPVQPLEPPPAPPANPVTATKIYLGKTLFWDEQLSSTRTVACGTCHHSATGGVDPRSVLATATSTHPGPDALFNTNDDIRGSAGVPVNNADGTYVTFAGLRL